MFSLIRMVTNWRPNCFFVTFRYSESLYALFSIGGVYHLLSGTSNVGVLWFALSGCARSNGILNAGYICFQTMHRAYEALYQKRRAYVSYTYFIQISELLLQFKLRIFSVVCLIWNILFPTIKILLEDRKGELEQFLVTLFFISLSDGFLLNCSAGMLFSSWLHWNSFLI